MQSYLILVSQVRKPAVDSQEGVSFNLFFTSNESDISVSLVLYLTSQQDQNPDGEEAVGSPQDPSSMAWLEAL